jgi:hypothetical protein
MARGSAVRVAYSVAIMSPLTCEICGLKFWGTPGFHRAFCKGPSPSERLAPFFAGIADWLNGRRPPDQGVS